MAQRVYWNFQDDDLTFDLNWRTLGILEFGRYRGFDATLDGTMVLKLDSSVTGSTKVNETPANEVFSIWYTRQGNVVTEDDIIPLNISNGDATFDRIDVIYGSHEYVASVGGAAATYAVIEGTPAASPVEPALVDTLRQVKLGVLYVPANTTALTDVGVVYTQENAPDFANDSSLVHENTENTFTETQTFNSVEEVVGSAEVAASLLTFLDVGLNQYNVTVPVPTPGTYEVVNTTSPVISVAGTNSKTIKFYTDTKLQLTTPLVDRDYFIDENTAFSIRFEAGGNNVLIQDEASLGRVNKYRKQQIFHFPDIAGILDGGGLATLTEDANLYFLGNTGGINQLRGISATSTFQDTSTEGGGMVAIMPNGGSNLNIKFADFTVGAGYKPIYTPNEIDLNLDTNGVLYFVEDLIYWRLVMPSAGYVDINPNFVLTGGTAPALAPIQMIYRAKLEGKTCTVEFGLNCTLSTGGGNITTIEMDFPFGQSAFNGLSKTVGDLSGVDDDFLVIGTVGAKITIQRQALAPFTNGNNLIGFRATFEIV